MIERLNDTYENPIRNHIQIGFEFIDDESECAYKIAKSLKDSNFDPQRSRVLIFSPTRNLAEEIVNELSSELASLNVSYKDKIDYYHAGLDGVVREEKYEDYKEGNVVILAATNAFGMGMDIKNIHFIYHLGPSSTFEDYLQEVGRAGRNKEMLHDAGFSDDNPIQAKCLLTKYDFNKLRDKNQKNQITWGRIIQIKDTVFSYYSKFRKLTPDLENPFPLPLDLLAQTEEYDDIFYKDTFFRIALYWLEKLDRIKLGVYTPTYLPIKILDEEPNFSFLKSKEERDRISLLLEYLKQYKAEKFSDRDLLMIDMTSLREKLNVKSSTEVFKILFTAQRARVISIERFIKIQPTKKRTPELIEWTRYNSSPIIDSTFSFAKLLIESSKLGDEVYIESEQLESMLYDVKYNKLRNRNLFWREYKNETKQKYYSNEELLERVTNDFVEKRSKFAFKIISFLEKFRHHSIIDIDPHTERRIATQIIYNGYKDNTFPLTYIEDFKQDLVKLIRYVFGDYMNKNTSNFNIVDLINELNLKEQTQEYFQKLVFISKGLGYLKGSGSLVPMGIEMVITDISDINSDTKDSKDNSLKEEFDESVKLKDLRLITLDCLSEIGKKEENDDIIKQKFNDFIVGYFQCGTTRELISLLGNHLEQGDSRLRAFREEALNTEKDKLNDSQIEVYDSDIRCNIQVAAGPGTGKTHTLTLRVARLIHEEKIKSENILVLAYNRSVVIELKNRLRKLFEELGYSKIISRLKIFTFHGFIKYCLGNALEDEDFESWTPMFLETMNNSPGLIAQRLGEIKYVFVDEFQDITSERLELLKRIADPDLVRVCVIGDPNQSIYGYQRALTNDPMDPRPYYDQFKEIYEPIEKNLDVNYRSYPDILTQARQLINLNQTRFELPELVSFKEPNDNDIYCEIIDSNLNRNIRWQDKLQEVINSHNQIAVMFRSNNEVFRGFNEIKNLDLTNVRIRIQGVKNSLFKSREFYHLIATLEEKKNLLLENDFKQEIARIKNETFSRYPNWDQYLLDLFVCLAWEFEKEMDDQSTYADFIDFVKELTSNDDGQYGKIYQQNINKIYLDRRVEKEIILTTMHKVKGLEFDAVIIPPSFSELPYTENGATLIENIEEERRLYYVAYTRAKYRLVVFQFDREKAMLDNRQYQPPVRQQLQLGIPFKDGLEKFKLFWGATNFAGSSFSFLRDHVSTGMALSLIQQKVGDHRFWNVVIGQTMVAQLSISTSNKISKYYHNNGKQIPEAIKGFSVSSISVHTYQETLVSDENNENQNFAERWNTTARQRGFIYIIDFSGYGK